MRRTELKCRIHINLGDSTLDGTHILHPHRHLVFCPVDAKDVLSSHIRPSARRTLHGSSTRPALALALPSVFFRSFQRALYLIPHTLLTLLSGASAALCVSLRDLVLVTQSASEARHAFEPAFPPFPHAALWKLLATFPPPVLGKLLAWMMLSEQLEETRLGPLAAPLAMENLVNVKEIQWGCWATPCAPSLARARTPS